jgi:hypothetical protein
MDFHCFSMDLKSSGARMLGGLWRSVPPCGGLWQRIGSPIRNISAGLEDVADRWEEGTGRTEDIEEFLEGLGT